MTLQQPSPGRRTPIFRIAKPNTAIPVSSSGRTAPRSMKPTSARQIAVPPCPVGHQQVQRRAERAAPPRLVADHRGQEVRDRNDEESEGPPPSRRRRSANPRCPSPSHPPRWCRPLGRIFRPRRRIVKWPRASRHQLRHLPAHLLLRQADALAVAGQHPLEGVSAQACHRLQLAAATSTSSNRGVPVSRRPWRSQARWSPVNR